MPPLGKARIFASDYQLVVCDDLAGCFADDENWNDESLARGFAGGARFRMLDTVAHLNVHWVELFMADAPPSPDEWQRITCASFRCETGQVHVMSMIDNEAAISASIAIGDYALYSAAQNLGIDQNSLGEDGKLSDAELAARKDVEWYRLFLVPGKPAVEGRLVDRPQPLTT